MSRSDQNIQLQQDQTAALLKQRGWKLVGSFEDAGLSGSTDKRPSFQDMMAAARKGAFDVIVVYRSDRLFRSLRDMIMTIDELASLGVGFVSVTEPLDTTTPTGRLMLQIVAAFAEFERNVLIERTKAGLAAARARGVVLGRPRVPVNVEHAMHLRQQGSSYREVAQSLGVALATLHRALRAAAKRSGSDRLH